jgi:hypothetical protein
MGKSNVGADEFLVEAIWLAVCSIIGIVFWGSLFLAFLRIPYPYLWGVAPVLLMNGAAVMWDLWPVDENDPPVLPSIVAPEPHSRMARMHQANMAPARILLSLLFGPSVYMKRLLTLIRMSRSS